MVWIGSKETTDDKMQDRSLDMKTKTSNISIILQKIEIQRDLNVINNVINNGHKV